MIIKTMSCQDFFNIYNSSINKIFRKMFTDSNTAKYFKLAPDKLKYYINF